MYRQTDYYIIEHKFAGRRCARHCTAVSVTQLQVGTKSVHPIKHLNTAMGGGVCEVIQVCAIVSSSCTKINKSAWASRCLKNSLFAKNRLKLFKNTFIVIRKHRKKYSHALE